MFTYYQAENSTAEPALVNAIEQGLRAQHGVVTEDDILMELTKGAMLDRQPNLGV